MTNIRRTVLMMGRKVEDLQSCPCGSTIGIDHDLVKSGTISTVDSACPIKAGNI
jgi:elongation factor 2